MMAISLSSSEIVGLAERVDRAQQASQPIAKLTDDFPTMNIADGYAVQLALRRRKLARGERSVGWKAGVTSRAKMVQVGVHAPTVGFLTNTMARPESSAIRTDDLLHPRVECEIAFVTREALRGVHCTREQVLAATDFVLPALEVIDSRYAGFSFDMPSVIADNCSAARYVTGAWPRSPRDVDLHALGVVFEKNGEVEGLAASAAVLGHPADAVAMLVAVLTELGEEVPAGSVVLSGGITEAVMVQASDHVSARFQHLGSVSTKFI